MAKLTLTSLDLGGLSSDLAADVGLHDVLTLDIAGFAEDPMIMPAKPAGSPRSVGVTAIAGKSDAKIEESSSTGSATPAAIHGSGQAGNETTANNELMSILEAIVTDSAEGFTGKVGDFTSSSQNPITSADEAAAIVHEGVEEERKKKTNITAPATPPAGLRAMPVTSLRGLARVSRYLNIRTMPATSSSSRPMQEVSTMAVIKSAPAAKRKLDMEPEVKIQSSTKSRDRRGAAHKMRLALRKDTPVIRTTRRGSMQEALAAGTPG